METLELGALIYIQFGIVCEHKGFAIVGTMRMVCPSLRPVKELRETSDDATVISLHQERHWCDAFAYYFSLAFLEVFFLAEFLFCSSVQ